MALVVLKFGGTSLANTKLMRNAVARVLDQVMLGNQVIVVVSAMAGVTDHLIGLVSEISSCENNDQWAEYANVITTGEQISAGLFALLVQEAGVKARSWLSWQMGIITDNNLADGEIIELHCRRIMESFKEGHQVAVVAGFQGITLDQRNSTLGRGGSDTSAIILAGHLKAQSCDIYTDVEGVFTGDPRIVAKAHKIKHINYDEMIEFAHSGAKILQEKSVRYAKHYQVKVQVLSSFTGNPGTIISNISENRPVLGVSISSQVSNTYKNLAVAKISVIGTNIGGNTELIRQLQQILETENIAILSVEISSMVLSFVVNEEYKFDATRLLHYACHLD